jgi:hypothetical protein
MKETVDRHGNRSPAVENFDTMPHDLPKVIPRSLKSHWHGSLSLHGMPHFR